MSHHKAQFISIEGIEGAGKTTAIAFVRDYLAKQNIVAYVTREPGGTPMAETIREVLLHRDYAEPVQAETELLLMFAARAQHLANCIRPRLQQGEWVISDRFIDASYAYQVGGRGLPYEFIEMLDRAIVQRDYPTLTILLDISPELGLQRAASRGQEKDRIEREREEFFARIRDVYLARHRADPTRIKLIDASAALPLVLLQLEQVLTTFMSSIT